MIGVLTELSGLGVDLALDDFGAGFSSLAQLKGLPVRELEIDRSFVTDMLHDRDDETIVRCIVEVRVERFAGLVDDGREVTLADEHLDGERNVATRPSPKSWSTVAQERLRAGSELALADEEGLAFVSHSACEGSS